MTMTSDFDRDFSAQLRAVLDAEAGPHPVWSESPAARKVVDRRRSRRGTLRLLAVAAVLLVGGAVVGGLLGRIPQQKGSPSNGWVAFGNGEIHLVKEGEQPRQLIGSPEDIYVDECPAFSPDGTRLAYTEFDLRFFEPTE